MVISTQLKELSDSHTMLNRYLFLIILFFNSISYADSPITDSGFTNATPDDLSILLGEDKQPILLFFDMPNCPYCRHMAQQVLQRDEIQQIYQQRWQITVVDILSERTLQNFDGETQTMQDFAQNTLRVRNTPVMVFFANDGELLYRFDGMIADPQEFLWLSDYVLEGHHEQQSFNEFKQHQRAQ